MDNNRRLAELLKIPWHDSSPYFSTGGYKCSACGATYSYGDVAAVHDRSSNPDFAADPRLVLWEMKEKLSERKWIEFVNTVGLMQCDDSDDLIKILFALDTTGLLRDKAIEFLEKEGKP